MGIQNRGGALRARPCVPGAGLDARLFDRLTGVGFKRVWGPGLRAYGPCVPTAGHDAHAQAGTQPFPQFNKSTHECVPLRPIYCAHATDAISHCVKHWAPGPGGVKADTGIARAHLGQVSAALRSRVPLSKPADATGGAGQVSSCLCFVLRRFVFSFLDRSLLCLARFFCSS